MKTKMNVTIEIETPDTLPVNPFDNDENLRTVEEGTISNEELQKYREDFVIAVHNQVQKYLKGETFKEHLEDHISQDLTEEPDTSIEDWIDFKDYQLTMEVCVAKEGAEDADTRGEDSVQA